MLRIKLFPTAEEKFHREAESALIAAVHAVFDRARQLYSGYDLPNPTVGFNLRGATAGKAFYGSIWEIRFNLDYMKNHWNDMIDNTVPHECAHLIAHRIYGDGIAAHGAEWRHIARSLGCDGSRCHDYEIVKARQTRRFIYSCGCLSGCDVGLNMHRKIQAGSVRICKSCNVRINRWSLWEEK